MIYLVTKEQRLFALEGITNISIQESLSMLNNWSMIQFDTETSGRDPHICKLLCMQFGNIKGDIQIVVDTTSVSPLLYKDVLESKYIIGQNLKFDLQFLYNYNIIPRKVYDTMIVEQLLHLGYPPGIISYSLKEIAWRRLKVDIDKTVRGEIIWRGLDTSVINYAAGDVKYLGDIMTSQIEDCKKQELLKAAKLECDFIPSIAYLEWCGIHLDQEKWKAKMKKDKENLMMAKKALDSFVESKAIKSGSSSCIVEEDFLISTDSYGGHEDFTVPQGAVIIKGSEYHVTGEDTVIYNYVKIRRPFSFCAINLQGDLFKGFDTTPHCIINWSSSKQVVNFAKFLGFDTQVKDKKTGEDKDSVLEKHLKTQKGINDEFLKLYFNYQEYAKVVSSFGQSHLDSINPKTDRIHTTYRQLSTSSGRLSCGSNQSNTDLAKFKKLSPSNCKYPNIQQLPKDSTTRGAFTAPIGYKWVSCDFSAEESRLGADIYQDKAFLKEFTEGSGDTHSMFAWAVFRKECEACGCKSVADVAKLAKPWRQAVKAVEFAYMFGAAAPTISQAANCTVEQAQAYIDALDKEFVGMSSFAKQGSAFVRRNGYIVISKHTGHKMYWWDHKEWLERQKSFTPEFWEEYRTKHKGTGDYIAQEVRQHFQAAGKYDRMARNVVTQGTGAIIMKDSMTQLFNWIVDHGYFGEVEISASIHDELNCIYPETLQEFPNVLKSTMEESAAKYCKSLLIPAEAEISDHWIH